MSEPQFVELPDDVQLDAPPPASAPPSAAAPSAQTPASAASAPAMPHDLHLPPQQQTLGHFTPEEQARIAQFAQHAPSAAALREFGERLGADRHLTIGNAEDIIKFRDNPPDGGPRGRISSLFSAPHWAETVNAADIPHGMTEVPADAKIDYGTLSGMSKDEVKAYIEKLPESMRPGLDDQLAHGFTAGLDTEAVGLAHALGSALLHPIDAFNSRGSSIVDAYHAGRKDVLARLDYVHMQHPYLAPVADVAGAVANPVGASAKGLAGMAKVAAGYGAVSGFENSDGTLGERVRDAGVGGVTGAVAAPLIGAAFKVPGAVRGLLRRGGEAVERPDYAQIARDLDIARTPATAGGPVASGLQRAFGVIPGGTGLVQKATSKEVADLGDAARAVAESVGPVTNRQAAGQAVAEGAESFAKTSKAAASERYGQRAELMGGEDAPVPTTQAKANLDEIAAQYPTSEAIADLRQHPAIRKIEAALPGEARTKDVSTGVLDANGAPITRPETTTPAPLTLKEATEALSYVRGASRRLAASGSDNALLARVDSFKNALNGDVKAAAAAADAAAGRVPGEDGSALKAHLDADRIYADRSAALNAATGPLGRAYKSAKDPVAVSGESVYNGIAGNMNKNTGNLAKLRDTWFRLPEEAKAAFAATKIDEMGRAKSGQQNDLGDVWSFDTFLTHRDSLSPQARNIVFGANADKQIDQIAAYASRLKALGRDRNYSNTAKNLFGGGILLKVGESLIHGDTMSAAHYAAIPVAGWGGAKLLLATPKMRDWTVSALRAATGRAGNQDVATKALAQRLGAIAVSEPAIADQVRGLQNQILTAVNDNARLSGSAAASSNQSGQDKQ